MRDEGMRSEFGLVSPKGIFHACDFYEHSALARELDANAEYPAWWGLRRGWLHVTHGNWKHEPGVDPTQDQLDAVLDWATAKPGRTYPKIKAVHY